MLPKFTRCFATPGMLCTCIIGNRLDKIISNIYFLWAIGDVVTSVGGDVSWPIPDASVRNVLSAGQGRWQQEQRRGARRHTADNQPQHLVTSLSTPECRGIRDVALKTRECAWPNVQWSHTLSLDHKYSLLISLYDTSLPLPTNTKELLDS